MNKKYLVSSIALVAVLLLTPVAFAYHRYDLRAQVMQPSAKKKKSTAAKEVQKIMDEFWRNSDKDLDWDDGEPDEEETELAVNTTKGFIARIQALVPSTKKDQRAVGKALKELYRHLAGLTEHLLRVTEWERISDLLSDAHQMEAPCWDEPALCKQKIAKFQEIDSQLVALGPKVAPYRQLAREFIERGNEVTNAIKDIQDSITEAQRQKAQQTAEQHAAEQPPASGFSSAAYPQIDEARLREYFQTNPLAICSGLSYDECGTKMESFIRGGGDLTEIAQWLVNAGGFSSTEEALIFLNKITNRELSASAYRIYRRYLR